MIRPTPRLLGLALAGFALAAVPVVFGPGLGPAWIAALALLGAAAVADSALAWGRRVDLALAPLAVVPIGAAGTLALTLAADEAGGPLEVDIELDLDPDLDPAPPGRAALAHGRAAEVRFPLRARRRGAHRVRAIWLSWRGPLGLALRIDPRPLEVALEVVPDTRPVRAAALRMASARDWQSGLKVEHYEGDGSEFESLRELLPGHDPRAIDWKASARHWKLVARSYRAERNHPVVIAFDTGHLLAEPLEGIPRLDHAVRAGLVLAWVGLKTGDKVGLFAFDDRVRAWAAPEGGMRAFPRIAARTAALAESRAETSFTVALAELGVRLARRTLVVIFTDFIDSVTAELMTGGLRRLARRHVIVFVALRDPALAAAAAARPATVDDLHRAVVAGDFIRERERVLERLRHRAIHCLDAAPGAVTTELVNRYLDIKRRELV